MHKIAVGVWGATGYTGRQLIGLLSAHPRVRIAFGSSESEAGTLLSEVVRGAPPLPLVRAEDADIGGCDLVFSCLPHGSSCAWVGRAHSAGVRVIDLSSDLRVPDGSRESLAGEAVYGLPELHRSRISGAELVANPGCYPTAALLALTPLLRRGLIAGPVIINAASGVTGAGRSPRRELLFGEVDGNFRAYAVGNTHRHLEELRDQTRRMESGTPPDLVFTPHLLPVKRGILATIYVPLREAIPDPVHSPWAVDFAGEPFIEILQNRPAELRDAVGSNRVVINAERAHGIGSSMMIVTVAIDNLLKGAAGQAVQNMNLMLGFPEAEGLP